MIPRHHKKGNEIYSYSWEANGKQHTVGINYFSGEPLLRRKSVVVPLTEYIRRTYGEEFRLSIGQIEAFGTNSNSPFERGRVFCTRGAEGY